MSTYRRRLAPPSVTKTVVTPRADPLPGLRHSTADIKASTDAVTALARRNMEWQMQNPPRKRDRSPSVESISHLANVDCTTAVYAPLDRPTKAPLLWLERAKRHAEALTAVAKHLADALEAEEKERPKAIERIDEWAAKDADGFDKAMPTHIDALAWFKDNLAFERVVTRDRDKCEDCSDVIKIVTLASTVRFASYVRIDHDDDDRMTRRWSKAAPARDPPPHDGSFMGVERVFARWRAATVVLPKNRSSFFDLSDDDDAGAEPKFEFKDDFGDAQAELVVDDCRVAENKFEVDSDGCLEKDAEDDDSEIGADSLTDGTERPYETESEPEMSIHESDEAEEIDEYMYDCFEEHSEEEFEEDSESDLDNEGVGKAVMALLPAVCPLRDIPVTAVVRLFKITTQLIESVDF